MLMFLKQELDCAGIHINKTTEANGTKLQFSLLLLTESVLRAFQTSAAFEYENKLDSFVPKALRSVSQRGGTSPVFSIWEYELVNWCEIEKLDTVN